VARNITERKQAEEQLRTSLKEKEVLLREIHHRVKNNLQIISSLLNLQASYIKDQATVEIFQESQHRVKSMALVHETLYQSKDLAVIDFAQYTRQLTGYLLSAYGVTSEVEVRIDFDRMLLNSDTAISCGLIINELVSNALKHAFPSETGRTAEIHIDLHLDNHQVTLAVSDNGIGFPPEIDFRQTETLGLQLVNLLVADELEGEIELDRNKGATFKITFSRSRDEPDREPEV
jgi:two-component sensor histidine kinase